MAGNAQGKRQHGQRREQVLGAARELFVAKGYRGTTIQEIARRAGYSKRTVYLDYQSNPASVPSPMHPSLFLT